MPAYLPFDPEPRAPARALPPQACDSQFHVLGPEDLYPVAPGAIYQMPSANWQAALRMHQTLGIERGVIVQATTYGADHRVVLDALAALNSASGARRYLACANAIVLRDGTDSYLQQLHDAGVRGARFTNGRFGIRFTPSQRDTVIGRLKELGWYVKIQPEPTGLSPQSYVFAGMDLGVPVLFDHMGRIDPTKGLSDPALAYLLELLQDENHWVMFSLFEKLSKAGLPYLDVTPFAERFIEAASDRCVWGSDWPHPLTTTRAPNEGDLVDLLFRFGDDAVVQRILVDNPARFFGFDLA